MLNAAALVIPTLVILVGILLNRADNKGLREEFNGLRGEFNGLRGEFSKLSTELRGEMADLRTDVTRQISAVREDVTRQIADVKDAGHRDALNIMQQMIALHERVAVVEDRNNRS